MKQITIEQVKPESEKVSQFVAGISTTLVSDVSKYVLDYENDPSFRGYIFRVWNNGIIDRRFGHSGIHKTRTEACYRFLICGRAAQLFEFDTELERTEWLQSQSLQP